MPFAFLNTYSTKAADKSVNHIPLKSALTEYKGQTDKLLELLATVSCPDGAYMCKHVSAVLYAIGAKLDEDPTLFFTLRGIDFQLFLAKTVEEKMSSMLKNAGKRVRGLLRIRMSPLFSASVKPFCDLAGSGSLSSEKQIMIV